MSLFVIERSCPEEHGRLAVCLQLAGLLIAGLLIAQTSPFLRWSRVPVVRLVLQSTALTALAWMTGAVVTLGLYVLANFLFFQDWGAGEMRLGVMRTAATAVWFVPAIVLAAVEFKLSTQTMAMANVGLVLLWLAVVAAIVREHRVLMGEAEAVPAFGAPIKRAV